MLKELELIGVLSVPSGGVGALQEKTVDPSTETAIVEPDSGYDGMSKVTVNAVTSQIDPFLTPTNVKNGVTILGVEGTLKQGYTSEITGNTLVLGNQDGADIVATVNESELNL